MIVNKFVTIPFDIVKNDFNSFNKSTYSNLLKYWIFYHTYTLFNYFNTYLNVSHTYEIMTKSNAEHVKSIQRISYLQ